MIPRLLSRVPFNFVFGRSAKAMDNKASEMQFIDLPRYSIAHIGSFLDDDSYNALTNSCRCCFFILANPFSQMPPEAIESIIKQCSQTDLIKLWRTCRFCYRHYISREKPLVIRCDKWIPSFVKKHPTRQLITRASNIISCAHRRAIPISLNLAQQSLRVDIDKSFVPKLFEMLTWDNTGNSVVELDLSYNFFKDFPSSLLHSERRPLICTNSPQAVGTINAAIIAFPNLTKLILDSNDLVAIPAQLSRLKLKMLSLAWNYLTSHSMGPCRDLTSLTELNFTRNFLTTIPLHALPPNLRILNVCDNPLDEKTRRLLEEGGTYKQLTIIFNNE